MTNASQRGNDEKVLLASSRAHFVARLAKRNLTPALLCPTWAPRRCLQRAAAVRCLRMDTSALRRFALLSLNEGVWGKRTMPLEIDPERVWTLSETRRQVLMELPPLLLPGQDETVIVRLRFDAETIDGFLERLTLLRSRMLSAPAVRQPI